MIRDTIRGSILYKPLSYMRADLLELPFRLCSFIFRLFPIESRKIVIENAEQREPSMITDALLANGNKFDIVWVVSSEKKYPDGVRVVAPDSFRYVYELTTACVWIDNSRKKAWVKKRKGQLYIQTWHSPVCIKKVEKDAIEGLTPSYIRAAKNDSKNIDYLVAESRWRLNNIRSAFWYDGPLIKGEFKDGLITGHIDREKLERYLGIGRDDHVVLYVPTFRKYGGTECYNIEAKKILQALEKKYYGIWKMVIRLHPIVEDKVGFIQYDKKVINGTAYQPLSDLINLADIIITDYSGCMFHGYRAGKSVFIFATDIDDYLKNERKTYFDLYDLPSPIATTNEELIENINRFDGDKYEEERQNFVKQIGYFENDAVTQIMEIMMRYADNDQMIL